MFGAGGLSEYWQKCQFEELEAVPSLRNTVKKQKEELPI
jgi:hypothetical protein